jgi:hypothetical protein
MPWHDDETALGPKQSLTSEGFLICRDVPLARIGIQHYAPYELPGVNGLATDRMIAVERTPAEVFDPRSVRSFEGKPLVDEHPLDMVDPSNITQHQIGHVFNVRRGAPPDDDVLLGDIMVTSPRGIALVRNGKRAVSVGYGADYIPTGPTSARQIKIRANHLALVTEGRCGARCQIGDAAMAMRPRDAINNPVGDPHDRALNSSWANIQTSDPNAKIGGELVMRLPPPLTAYYLSADTDGNPAVFRYPLPALDPGQGSMGEMPSRMPATTRDRSFYAGVQQWSNGQRERGRQQSSVALRSINQANAAHWEKAKYG